MSWASFQTLVMCVWSTTTLVYVSKSFYSRFYSSTTFLPLQESHSIFFYHDFTATSESFYLVFTTPVSKLDSIFLFFYFSTMLPISFFYHLYVYIYMYHTLHVLSWLCYRTVTPCVAVIVCDVEFGYWVCGESWPAVKDSLTHRPSSQGWAPSVLLSCHVMCICVCVFLYGCFGICGYIGGGFISLSIYLSIYTYGWYSMNYNFVY